MNLFRNLRAEEIECRVSRVTDKGVVLLLYKTARTDADLLDETFGPGRWKNDFQIIDGVLYGGIGIYFEDITMSQAGIISNLREWVWKWDAGTESNTEAEKGRASDAFKRAGFKWGLGRELYSAPFIFVPAGKCRIVSGKCNDKFDVADIAYDANNKICHLRIEVKGETVYIFTGNTAPVEAPKPAKGFEQEPFVPTCAECGKEISEKVHDYSVKKYGRPLCMECQRNG